MHVQATHNFLGAQACLEAVGRGTHNAGEPRARAPHSLQSSNSGVRCCRWAQAAPSPGDLRLDMRRLRRVSLCEHAILPETPSSLTTLTLLSSLFGICLPHWEVHSYEVQLVLCAGVVHFAEVAAKRSLSRGRSSQHAEMRSLLTRAGLSKPRLSLELPSIAALQTISADMCQSKAVTTDTMVCCVV